MEWMDRRYIRHFWVYRKIGEVYGIYKQPPNVVNVYIIFWDRYKMYIRVYDRVWEHRFQYMMSRTLNHWCFSVPSNTVVVVVFASVSSLPSSSSCAIEALFAVYLDSGDDLGLQELPELMWHVLCQLSIVQHHLEVRSRSVLTFLTTFRLALILWRSSIARKICHIVTDHRVTAPESVWRTCRGAWVLLWLLYLACVYTFLFPFVSIFFEVFVIYFWCFNVFFVILKKIFLRCESLRKLPYIYVNRQQLYVISRSRSGPYLYVKTRTRSVTFILRSLYVHFTFAIT